VESGTGSFYFAVAVSQQQLNHQPGASVVREARVDFFFSVEFR
jgi:hypothetical protein